MSIEAHLLTVLAISAGFGLALAAVAVYFQNRIKNIRDECHAEMSELQSQVRVLANALARNGIKVETGGGTYVQGDMRSGRDAVGRDATKS